MIKGGRGGSRSANRGGAKMTQRGRADMRAPKAGGPANHRGPDLGAPTEGVSGPKKTQRGLDHVLLAFWNSVILDCVGKASGAEGTA